MWRRVEWSTVSNASSLLAAARNLRKSDDQYTANNIYINPDLSPAAAKDAYDRRQRRHAQGQGQGHGSSRDRGADAKPDSSPFRQQQQQQQSEQT